MRYGASPIVAAILVALAAVLPQSSARAADKARISGLSDVDFGLVAALGDQSRSQSVCAYTSSNSETYSITAVGDGPGGSFSLSSGGSQLDYDVLWADAPNMSSGTALFPNVPRSGFISSAKQHFCNSGPPTSASLTVVLRDAVLRSARSGSYAGTLQITIAPE